jgi:SAM-dependent methyltransferase
VGQAVARDEVGRTYDALAPRYDDWSAQLVPDVRVDWAGKVDAYVAAGERVVELGCGTAVPVGRLLSQRYDYTGVDSSPGMLAEARAVLPDVVLTEADMHAVEYRPGSLGAVVAFFSISHTPRERHAQLFTAIASWVRPGGVFVGNLNSRDEPGGFDPDWLGAGPMRWSGFDAATNAALLDAAGFRVVESAVITQIEPEGGTIEPMWFVAQRTG